MNTNEWVRQDFRIIRIYMISCYPVNLVNPVNLYLTKDAPWRLITSLITQPAQLPVNANEDLL